MKYYKIDLNKFVLHHAGKSVLPSDWQHYERTFHETIIYIVTEGSLYLNVDSTPYHIKESESYVIKPFARHVGYKPAAVSYYWLHCIFENLEELDEEEAEIFQKQNDNPDILLIPMYFKLKKTENIVILLNQLIHYIINNHRNPIIPYLSKAVLIELCNQQHYYESEIDHKNRRFLEVVAYINAHFKEPINISELAAQFGYNEKYLVRLFRKNYQITIKDFINQTRLRYAERILLETSDPVKKIADKAGYSDAYYFMRLFKKFYGISPTQYRNAYYNQNYTKYEDH